jgi:inversin
VSIKDKDGMSPSMWACHLDHLEHFKLLNKLEITSRKSPYFNFNEIECDNDGRTWLHWSVRKNEPFECLNVI